ncbi:hypothetical protein QMK33_08895 [Hymenobacter sp. H14-R3]|uniref:hypothetical protein n=1 Tax=Hymenobacter sp. H14-R3 TaxID=3046308 RepID=UPI0024BB2E97|nr:hypothetical protein [Hymenobacter sp. H14-R3]MDJ0365269.1 hypothetical protein [Hymenobacter sp. H14-R3]
MPFCEDYLRSIVANKVVGDFPPFTSGSITKTDNYIRKVLARLSSSATLLFEADFSSYGSGFASYVEVRVSKKDRSDTVTLAKYQRVTYETTGLLLYISRLTPYWFYGGSDWGKTYEQGQLTGGGHRFLDSDSQDTINQALWQPDRQHVEAVLQEFRYGLLTPEELQQPAPAGIFVPTVLSDGPYTVFDCFFYWQD